MGVIQRIHSVEGVANPVGPYSLATISPEGLVYTAGQVGMKPDGTLVDGGVEAETHQAMQNLARILGAAAIDLSKVLKATIYVTDINDFGRVNQVYGSWFPEGEYPARETVGAAALPLGAHVEISMVAMRVV